MNAELLREIQRLENLLDTVNGTPCEVYSRVVGFFRPVKDWNAGKQSEYHERVEFEVQPNRFEAVKHG